MAKIVEATTAFSGARDRDLARRIEAAMSGAALQAHAEGETDPAKIKARMLDARDRVKAAGK